MKKIYCVFIGNREIQCHNKESVHYGMTGYVDILPPHNLKKCFYFNPHGNSQSVVVQESELYFPR